MTRRTHHHRSNSSLFARIFVLVLVSAAGFFGLVHLFRSKSTPLGASEVVEASDLPPTPRKAPLTTVNDLGEPTGGVVGFVVELPATDGRVRPLCYLEAALAPIDPSHGYRLWVVSEEPFALKPLEGELLFGTDRYLYLTNECPEGDGVAITLQSREEEVWETPNQRLLFGRFKPVEDSSQLPPIPVFPPVTSLPLVVPTEPEGLAAEVVSSTR